MDEFRVDWRKMYLRMVDAADKAVCMIEHGEYSRAAAELVEAMNACEDMYIDGEM